MRTHTIAAFFLSALLIARAEAQRVPLLILPQTAPILAAADRTNPASAQHAAVCAIQQLQPSLHLSSEAELSPISTRQVANVWHTAFRLSYRGIPVREASIATNIGAINGKLLAMTNHIPNAQPNAFAATIAPSMIESITSGFLDADSTLPITSQTPLQLVYLHPRGSRRLKLCYETTVRQFGHAWRLTIDALTGKLRQKKDMLEYIGGDKPEGTITGKLQASIHMHSPTDTLTTVGLDNAYLKINGKRLLPDSAGNWQYDGSSPIFVTTGFYGPWLHVVRHDDETDTANLWLISPYLLLWNDFDSHAAERDAFYHANVAREYAHSIDTGLTAIDSQLTLNVNLDLTCNAFYDADSISLNFFRSGTKCSNSGEIADVIYHEFGHRIAHVRYTNSANSNLVNYTLGEGFADLCSAFLRDDPRIGIGFFTGQPDNYLRTCDNRMIFPDSISADPHISGEIISGAFWDLRKTIGHDAAERLFRDVEWLNPDGPDETAPDILHDAFLETLTDVLIADDTDNDLTNGTPHSDAILAAFAKHGITLASLIHLDPASLPDQDSMSTSYSVTLKADYGGPLGAIDATNIELHYSTDGHTYQSCLFVNLHDSIYQAAIPKAAPGSIVSYYVSARLLQDTAHDAFWPPSSQPLQFTVGFTPGYFDDCEQDRGWSLSSPTDFATSGLWVRDTPFGTYNLPNDYVHQDTDHTPNGAMCYVTGNLHDPDIDADDVDGGATTLTTNAIDLSHTTTPVLRYWYYYSNDQGDNPGVTQWETQISGDDGAHWKTIQFTNLSTLGWTSTVFRVSDYVTPSATVRLRFIASDYVGAIVEAGIDDIEALAPPEGASSAVIGSGSSQFEIAAVRPNPAMTGEPLSIDYSLPEASHVTLELRNVFGDRVSQLEDRWMTAGMYHANCSITALPAGVYWLVLSTPNTRAIQKVVVE